MTQKQQQVPKPHQRQIRHTQAKQTWEIKANSRREGNPDQGKGLQKTNRGSLDRGMKDRAAEPAPGKGTNAAEHVLSFKQHEHKNNNTVELLGN